MVDELAKVAPHLGEEAATQLVEAMKELNQAASTASTSVVEATRLLATSISNFSTGMQAAGDKVQHGLVNVARETVERFLRSPQVNIAIAAFVISVFTAALPLGLQIGEFIRWIVSGADPHGFLSIVLENKGWIAISFALSIFAVTLCSMFLRVRTECSIIRHQFNIHIRRVHLDAFSICPPGSIIAYSGDMGTEPPSGWLWCNGETKEVKTFPQLAEVLGNKFGPCSDVLHFKLPDFRGYFLRGADCGTSRDPDAQNRQPFLPENSGDKVGSVQTFKTALPAIKFSVSGTTGTMTANASHSHMMLTGWCKAQYEDQLAVLSGPKHTSNIWDQPCPPTNTDHCHPFAADVQGGDKQTCPSNISVNYLIKI